MMKSTPRRSQVGRHSLLLIGTNGQEAILLRRLGRGRGSAPQRPGTAPSNSVACVASGIAETLPSDRNKLPVVACRMKCQLQHAEGAGLTDFAVRSWIAECASVAAAR